MAAQISLVQTRPLESNPGFSLEENAQLAWDRSIVEYGKTVLISGAWRSYQKQVELFDSELYPKTGRYVRGNHRGEKGYTNDVRGLYRGSYWTRKAGTDAAAVPGTSNHGSGLSVDVKTRRQPGDAPYPETVVWNTWDDDDRAAFLKIANENGWYDDEGRSVDEVWHLTYYPTRDRHRGEPVPREEFLMSLSDEDQEAVLWNVRENRKLLTEIRDLLKAPIKDGKGAAEPRAISERTLDVSRRTLAAVEALAGEAPPDPNV